MCSHVPALRPSLRLRIFMLKFQTVVTLLLEPVHHGTSLRQLYVGLTAPTPQPVVQSPGFSLFHDRSYSYYPPRECFPCTEVMYGNGTLQLLSCKKPIYMLHKPHNSAKSTQSGDVRPGLQTPPHLLREELARPQQSEDDFQRTRQPPRKYITFMHKLVRHFRGAYYNKKGSSHPSNCTSLSLTRSCAGAHEEERWSEADVCGCKQLQLIPREDYAMELFFPDSLCSRQSLPSDWEQTFCRPRSSKWHQVC